MCLEPLGTSRSYGSPLRLRAFLVLVQAPRCLTNRQNWRAPAQWQKKSNTLWRKLSKAGCNVSPSLAPRVSQRDQESISESHRPHVGIPSNAELPPVVGARLQSVYKIIVHPELEQLGVCGYQRVI